MAEQTTQDLGFKILYKGKRMHELHTADSDGDSKNAIAQLHGVAPNIVAHNGKEYFICNKHGEGWTFRELGPKIKIGWTDVHAALR